MSRNRPVLLTALATIMSFAFVVSSLKSGEAADCDTGAFLSKPERSLALESSTNKNIGYCNDGFRVIESNGVQSIPFEQTTPNQVRPQPLRYNIPRIPKESATAIRMPLLGPVAVAIDGLPFFGPNEAPPTFGDPIADELLDSCNGHPNGQGLYHYHALPTCLIGGHQGEAGVVVGYAFDGYPILSPFECVEKDCAQTYEVKSSYAYVGGSRNVWQAHEYRADLGHLDECNGMFRPDGSYAYYATDTFPYVISCYHGQPQQQTGELRLSERRGRPPRGRGTRDRRAR